MATFRIQWDVGRNYGVSPSPTISDPFAPAYILIGTGIGYITVKAGKGLKKLRKKKK